MVKDSAAPTKTGTPVSVEIQCKKRSEIGLADISDHQQYQQMKWKFGKEKETMKNKEVQPYKQRPNHIRFTRVPQLQSNKTTI